MAKPISAGDFYAQVPRLQWQLLAEGAVTHYPCQDARSRAEFARLVADFPDDDIWPDLELRREGITVRLPGDGTLAAKAYGRPVAGGRGGYVSFPVPDRPELVGLIARAADEAAVRWAAHAGVEPSR